MLPRKAKGRRPVYFSPETDRLTAVVMALAAETSVLRERLDTVERLLAARGAVTSADIEGFVPDAEAAAARERWREQYLARLLRAIDRT